MRRTTDKGVVEQIDSSKDRTGRCRHRLLRALHFSYLSRVLCSWRCMSVLNVCFILAVVVLFAEGTVRKNAKKDGPSEVFRIWQRQCDSCRGLFWLLLKDEAWNKLCFMGLQTYWLDAQTRGSSSSVQDENEGSSLRCVISIVAEPVSSLSVPSKIVRILGLRYCNIATRI